MSERAPAKVNLLLHVGPPRAAGGLHEVCSLFASIDLADEVTVEERRAPGGAVTAAAAPAAEDTVDCHGVPGPNLAAAALRAFRAAAGHAAAGLPPLAVTIAKRIPVAAGLGGGSADAAATLRAANELAGAPLTAQALRELAAPLGSDVPSQIEPVHALVTGTGERVEPLALPAMALVLVPDRRGLAAAEAYAEADRLGTPRPRLDPEEARALAAAPLPELARALESDLEPAVLSLRPEVAGRLARLREAGALAALVTGSGPTAVGVFAAREQAERAAAAIAEALVTIVSGR